MIKYHDKSFFDAYCLYLKAGEAHEDALDSAYSRHIVNIAIFELTVFILGITTYSIFDGYKLISVVLTRESSLSIKLIGIGILIFVETATSYFLLKRNNRKAKIIEKYRGVSPCTWCAHILSIALLISVCFSMFIFGFFMFQFEQWAK